MLVSLANLKTLLGVTGTAEDARLTLLLAQADNWVKAHCRRRFERETGVEEYYSGTGTRLLVLRERPVVEVSDVRLSFAGYYGQGPAAFGAETALVQGVDYTLRLERNSDGFSESGILVRTDRPWPLVERVAAVGRLTNAPGPAYGNIRVTYTFGYDPAATWPDPAAVPPALVTAVAMLVGFWRRSLQYGGRVERERLGRWEVEMSSRPAERPAGIAGVPDEVYGILAPFCECLL